MSIQYIIQLGLYSAIPLIGILFFGWDWRQILVLYWLENITVGAIAVITILRTPTSKMTSDATLQANGIATINPELARWFMAGFFCLHYGCFTLFHGIFVFAIVLSDEFSFGPLTTDISLFASLHLGAILISWLIGSTVHIIVQLLKQPEQQQSIGRSFANPYKRIIALHTSIIAGAFLITMLQIPAMGAIFLIVIHVILDITMLRKTKASSPISNSPKVA